MRILDHSQLSNKKILVIDESLKNTNDRTWCFWEDQSSYFEELIYKRWDNLFFKTESCKVQLKIEPYVYKMIRGIDFYDHCLKKIKANHQVTFLQGKLNVSELYLNGSIIVDEKFTDTEGAIIFNSIYQRPDLKNGHHLLQHFTGWVIETKEDVFSEATLMDFSTSQEYGTAFFYVLPFSNKKALVEYTLFTKSILEKEAYDLELKRYISEIIGISEYDIRETEFGIIPMSSIKPPYVKNGIYQIGVAGGMAKGSTGYAFKFIQEHSDFILSRLLQDQLPVSFLAKSRFLFYDSILLHILSNRTLSGKEIFQKLFEKNKANEVFKFLDNKTTLRDEIKIISKLPTLPFLKAAIKELVN